MDISTIKQHLAEAVAAAALLGGGAQLVMNTVDIGRHDERLSDVEALNNNVQELRDELADTKVLLVEVRTTQQLKEQSE